jgi:hypothetical protein
LTLGRNPVFLFMNEDSGRQGLDPRAIAGVRVRDRFSDAWMEWWLKKSDEAFGTGAPASLENATSLWLRDDGAWVTGTFDCVLQPVRDVIGNVNGILWICALTGSASSCPTHEMS